MINKQKVIDVIREFIMKIISWLKDWAEKVGLIDNIRAFMTEFISEFLGQLFKKGDVNG